MKADDGTESFKEFATFQRIMSNTYGEGSFNLVPCNRSILHYDMAYMNNANEMHLGLYVADDKKRYFWLREAEGELQDSLHAKTV